MRLQLPVCLVVGVLFTAPARSAAPPRALVPAADFVLSGSRKIRVERFEPKGNNRLPAVLLLHGLDGLPQEGGLYRSLSRRLATKGYVVLLIHYFDRTATNKEDLPELSECFRAYLETSHKGGKQTQRLRSTFGAWLTTVSDTIAYARRLPRVDPDRVGLVGVSMGGFLCTSAAMQPELRISCAVELFGGLPGKLVAELTQMPPTLILHGDCDEVVPVRHAHALGEALAKRNLPFELKVYRGVGHGFQTARGGTSWISALDAEVRAVRFLERHLVARKVLPSPFRPGQPTEISGN